MDDEVTMLGRPCMVSLVLYIGDNPGCRKTDIYRDVRRNLGMAGKIDALVETGLVRADVVERDWAEFSLTPEGEKVVEILREIDSVLEDAARLRAEDPESEDEVPSESDSVDALDG